MYYQRFKLTGCTKECKISFTVANTGVDPHQVKLFCSLGGSDEVSGFIRSSILLLTHISCTNWIILIEYSF